MEEGEKSSLSLDDGLHSSQSIPLQALGNKTELHSLGSLSMHIRKKQKFEKESEKEREERDSLPQTDEQTKETIEDLVKLDQNN